MPVDFQPPPVTLSRQQVDQIQQMNRDVNWHFPRVRDGATSGPRGACMWNAQMKMWALQGMGVPASAMRFKDYAVRGASDPYHRVVELNVSVDGKPQTYLLDMNSSWLRQP